MRREELTGRVALVTGAGRGIGKVIAARLVREGARVAIAGLPADGELERAAAELGEGEGEGVLGVPADLRDVGDVDRVFDTVQARLGTVDILVNNAGGGALTHFLEETPQGWDDAIGTNLRTTYSCMHRAAIGMVESARAGCIVNISSIGAGRAHRTFAAYDAAKAGVEALTRGAALDLAPFRIRVNAVAPGAIEVERSAESPDHARAQRAAPIPLGRVGRCSDVAAAVAFLCSDDAAYITGQVLTVDGGMSAQLLPPQLDFPMPPSVVERLAGRLR